MSILADLNPAQQEAVTFGEGPLLILAGAGSGKTRVLTRRVAYLIEQGVPAESILLMTFTNKASEEMLRRISGTKPTGGTFHSFCARLLRKNYPDFVIFDEADQLDTIKQAMVAVGVDPKAVKPASVLHTISQAKNELIGPAEYADYARGDFQKMVVRVYMAYQQLLKKYKAMDFDDLLIEAVKLLREQPEEGWKYVLVDEYQDTNKAQYEITKLLTKKHRNLTVVGDAAQAIYSWRGADYRNLLLLKQDFPDLTTINLEQNYRSTQVILNAANKVISKNKNHPVLKLWTAKNGGAKIGVFEASSESDEAMYVISQLKGDYSDYAVLYRTNAQSRVFEEAFLHAGIPYVLVGGTRFYERKEIKDVVCYLRLVMNPEDDVAKKRAEKLGKTRLAKLEPSGTKTIEILDSVLKSTGYIELFNPDEEEDLARLENIKELRSVAMEFPKLPEFLENIALTEREANRRRSSGSAVTLMTLHAAKGLEFKNVFLVGMEEGLFPHSRALMDPEQMEEERRLAYVGMTRAMDKLYLTYARRRLYFGTRNNNPVSRFLADIPEELLETSSPPSSRKAGLRRDKWGFDASGNWQWKPEDDIPF
ncbi:MAG: ATP-dependent DNA helicase PcrA [Candidatus Amesbacteria bacterium GW2011_GWA2_47_11b]|uniref:DNA 3'-5' helicase n=3 Tax=Candidatus Amesiibacteriota TaxID=1752730 RepID=A0A0G1SKI0_9BACT|nr:MAG: ATP-dependent DNA helicase PcrA [Microgenomates group bacterium GW2011_GWC1_46_20]KKU57974.1 MAG: ATP-dependent DNA helicase PcrA [Candidatus Amesbacteria bacterium GW2011_GWA2_47_11b]KKU69999.1 MAG: ATP-dependent DNA helicase PcrA [Candidatus Amesbacteria bacterium GW2011_GWA1_47_20]KKU84864.1 MAG: ATP-dependent DNA helicase PcrA [Candidatus Amesbacteria bacterium GW2011_GWC2_47_8]